MNPRLIRLLFAGVLACSLATVPLWAQGNGHENGKGKGHDKHERDDDGHGRAKYEFRSQDREVVTTYYSKARLRSAARVGEAERQPAARA
jgi:hypothetical protein